MNTKAVADDLVAMWTRGEWEESGEKYWADDVVSVEAMGPPGADRTSRGKDAARAKGEWWQSNHEVHSSQVAGGPWMNGDQFVVQFKMDVTSKIMGGQRIQLDETALYTIRDGKIVEERFFMRPMPSM